MKQRFNTKWLKATLGICLMSAAVVSNAETKMMEVMMDISPQEMLNIAKESTDVTKNNIEYSTKILGGAIAFGNSDNTYAISFNRCIPNNDSIMRRCKVMEYVWFPENIKENLSEKANIFNKLTIPYKAVVTNDGTLYIKRSFLLSEGVTKGSLIANLDIIQTNIKDFAEKAFRK